MYNVIIIGFSMTSSSEKKIRVYVFFFKFSKNMFQKKRFNSKIRCSDKQKKKKTRLKRAKIKCRNSIFRIIYLTLLNIKSLTLVMILLLLLYQKYNAFGKKKIIHLFKKCQLTRQYKWQWILKIKIRKICVPQIDEQMMNCAQASVTFECSATK